MADEKKKKPKLDGKGTGTLFMSPAMARQFRHYYFSAPRHGKSAYKPEHTPPVVQFPSRVHSMSAVDLGVKVVTEDQLPEGTAFLIDHKTLKDGLHPDAVWTDEGAFIPKPDVDPKRWRVPVIKRPPLNLTAADQLTLAAPRTIEFDTKTLDEVVKDKDTPLESLSKILKQYYLPAIKRQMNEESLFVQALKAELDGIRKDTKADMMRAIYGGHSSHVHITTSGRYVGSSRIWTPGTAVTHNHSLEEVAMALATGKLLEDIDPWQSPIPLGDHRVILRKQVDHMRDIVTLIARCEKCEQSFPYDIPTRALYHAKDYGINGLLDQWKRTMQNTVCLNQTSEVASVAAEWITKTLKEAGRTIIPLEALHDIRPRPEWTLSQITATVKAMGFYCMGGARLPDGHPWLEEAA